MTRPNPPSAFISSRCSARCRSRPTARSRRSPPFEPLRSQVPLQDVELGDLVGDGGPGGEGAGPAAVPAAGRVQLHLQVDGPVDEADRHARLGGGDPQVVEVLRLIDADVVGAHLLPAHPRVLLDLPLAPLPARVLVLLLVVVLPGVGVEVVAQLLLELGEHRLLVLDRLGDGLHVDGEHLLHVVQVGLVALGGQRDRLERSARHDDRVRVLGGAPGDELPPPVPFQVVGVGAQDPRLRVRPEELIPELVQQVVLDADDRLADQAEPPLLHHPDDLLQRLPGAHVVDEPCRGLVDHPGDGGLLPPEQDDVPVHPGQGQLHVVIGAQDHRVERVVVAAAHSRRPGPGPPTPSRRTGPTVRPAFRGRPGGLLIHPVFPSESV